VTTVELAGRRMAAGGGGFFRLLPYRFSDWAVSRVNGAEDRPAIFYFHPWEIDPGQPVVANCGWKSRLRHYSNLSRMAAKLDRAMHDFAWDRMDRVFAPVLAEASPQEIPSPNASPLAPPQSPATAPV